MTSGFFSRASSFKTVVIALPIVAVSVAMGTWIGRSFASPLNNLLKIQPRLILSVSTMNFGKLPVGDRVTKSAILRNEGYRDLIISDASGTCGCTDVVVGKKILRRGEETSLRVTLTGRQESTSARVLITSNDSVNPRQFIYLESEAPMPVTLIPARIEFTGINHASLPAEKTLIVQYSDIGMFLRSSKPKILVDTEMFKVKADRDFQNYRYNITLTLLPNSACGEFLNTLRITDPDSLFDISAEVETNINSRFWHNLSNAVLHFDKSTNNNKTIDLKHKIDASLFAVTDISYSDSLKGKITAKIQSRSDHDSRIVIAFNDAHYIENQSYEGHIKVSAKELSFDGYTESFTIPITLLLGTSTPVAR